MSPMPITNENVIAELRSIADKHDGLLMPEDVVKAARSPQSPLHSRFEWDDGAAASQYRLYQARVLIRCTIEYVDVGGSSKPINVFCSLTTDREAGGGYREIEDVLKRKKHRDQLLADALKEMQSFIERYKTLRKLSGVVSTMKKVLKAVA